jgi:2-polyprenyl-3-methyl-5-hydroxy-6-metoxy-1,4-benzoquinol methylase
MSATDIVECPVTSEDAAKLNALGRWRYFQVVPESPLPFDAASFDLVFHHDVIEHVQKPFLFLSECARILKDGGYVVLTTPNLMRPGNLIRLAMGRLRFPFVGDEVVYGGSVYSHGHVQEFASWTLVLLLEEAGFVDVKVVPCYFGFPPLGIRLSGEPRTAVGQGLAHNLLVYGRRLGVK